MRTHLFFNSFPHFPRHDSALGDEEALAVWFAAVGAFPVAGQHLALFGAGSAGFLDIK